MYYYTRSIEIAADLEKVFAFHIDPSNLLRITPRYLRVKLLQHDHPGAGAEVKLLVRPLGLFPQHWHLRFDLFDAPRRLGDIMLSGPLPHWRQVREFIPLRNGNCLLNDSVKYEVPFGRFGKLAHPFLIRRMIRAMFASRQKITKKLLEGA